MSKKPRPAPWDVLEVPVAQVRVRRDGTRYNAAAGMARNAWMAAYGTHLVAFWDGKSPGTRGMIRLAEACGLPVWRPGAVNLKKAVDPSPSRYSGHQ